MKKLIIFISLAASIFLGLSIPSESAEKMDAPEMPEKIIIAPTVESHSVPSEADQGVRTIRIRGFNTDKATTAEQLHNKIEELANILAHGYSHDDNEIVVATFVDADRLNRSNTFGRFVADDLTARMHGLGFAVLELRAGKKVMMQPNVGTQVLSDDPADVGFYRPSVVLSGTYKKVGDVLSLQAKIVSHTTQKVLSTASVEMKFDKEDAFIKDLMENSLERVGRVGKVGK